MVKVPSLNRMQNRAFFNRSITRALHYQMPKSGADSFERPNPLAHFFYLPCRVFLYFTRLRTPCRPEGQQLPNFCQRKSEILRVLDESHSADRVSRITAVIRRGTGRRGNEAAPFVIPKGLDVDLRRFGELASVQYVQTAPLILKVKPCTQVQGQVGKTDAVSAGLWSSSLLRHSLTRFRTFVTNLSAAPHGLIAIRHPVTVFRTRPADL